MRARRRSQLGFDIEPAPFEIAKLLLDALGGRAVGERVHEALDLPDDAIMLGAQRGRDSPRRRPAGDSIPR